MKRQSLSIVFISPEDTIVSEISRKQPKLLYKTVYVQANREAHGLNRLVLKKWFCNRIIMICLGEACA